MGHRKFQDRAGQRWQVRAESKHRWRFEPLRGNEERERSARPPGYADDPFELSEKELQRILEGARPSGPPEGKPPLFRDEA